MHTMHTFVNKFVLQHIFITKKKKEKSFSRENTGMDSRGSLVWRFHTSTNIFLESQLRLHLPGLNCSVTTNFI